MHAHHVRLAGPRPLETARATEGALALAIADAYGAYAFIADWDERHVYFVVGDGRGLSRQPYSLDASTGNATLTSEPERVRPRTAYQPAKWTTIRSTRTLSSCCRNALDAMFSGEDVEIVAHDDRHVIYTVCGTQELCASSFGLGEDETVVSLPLWPRKLRKPRKTADSRTSDRQQKLDELAAQIKANETKLDELQAAQRRAPAPAVTSRASSDGDHAEIPRDPWWDGPPRPLTPRRAPGVPEPGRLHMVAGGRRYRRFRADL